MLGVASTGAILSHRGNQSLVAEASFSGLEAVCGSQKKGTLGSVLRAPISPSPALKSLALDSITHEILQKVNVKTFCSNGPVPVLYSLTTFTGHLTARRRKSQSRVLENWVIQIFLDQVRSGVGSVGLLLTYCVNLGKLINLSGPPFSHQ